MLAVDIKADHDIVAQRFILGIGIKAVHLHSPLVGKDCFLQRIAYLGGFIIGGVVGGWVFSLLGIGVSSIIGSIVCAVIGAVIVLWIFNKLF